MSDDEIQPGFSHEPVLLDLIVELFAPAPPGVLLDATLGGAGHAAAILEAHPHLQLLGVDQDPEALSAAGDRLARFSDRVTLRHDRFDRVELPELSGALFDLGVSSHQLDRAERGFSYRAEAPLDMRMDPTHGRTAAEVVNETGQTELADLLRTYADERYAGRIARAIVAARPILTTTDLAEIVRAAIPAPARRKGGHPAKRTFQAIRIAVNDELVILPLAIDRVIDRLVPSGRFAVLAYHSGEDRIVKARFRHAATGGWTGPAHLPVPDDVRPSVRLLKQGSWKPTAAEIAANPRAESARLRALEKHAPTATPFVTAPGST